MFKMLNFVTEFQELSINFIFNYQRKFTHKISVGKRQISINYIDQSFYDGITPNLLHSLNNTLAKIKQVLK